MMMKIVRYIIPSLALILLCSINTPREWKQNSQKGYTLHYKGDDESETKRYRELIDKGVGSVTFFTKSSFAKEFKVYVHPSRAALDNQWQTDWNMPDFKSHCWMVASGTASKLDLLSPLKWKTEACEHTYADRDKTQKVITHELFHVYHGQHNPSPDFSQTEGIDWFVEGFAAYASGQCDKDRLDVVKKSVLDKTSPSSLDAFWTGNLRYGWSGSMAMFIDKKYGREKILSLLVHTTKAEILGSLKTNEADLLKEWADYIVGS
jgi:hypothetical protein